MKVKELRERLSSFDDNDEVVISISAHKNYNAQNSYASIMNLYRGFQKVSDKVLLVAEDSLSFSGNEAQSNSKNEIKEGRGNE